MKIAIDAMGGDFGPSVTVPAALQILQRYPDVEVLLVGQEELLTQVLSHQPQADRARVRVVHAAQVVSMDDVPSQALRGKRHSSMRVAIDLVRDGQADAVVSAGNTGALMAIGKVVLRTIPGVLRPAIASVVPTRMGQTLLLDLGANVDCNGEHLLQFAVMGSVMTALTRNIPRPSVGLLNVGEEEIKGNEVVKDAGQRLRQSNLNYVGNVEGSDIYAGKTDVVVCDGFVGNVALKVSEGLAAMMIAELKLAYYANWYTRLAGLLSRPALQRFRARLDPRHYNGGALLGLNGIVIKSHGNADVYAFSRAIEVALNAARGRLIDAIATEVQSILQAHGAAEKASVLS